jgi:hypothetical protein
MKNLAELDMNTIDFTTAGKQKKKFIFKSKKLI